ncbi:hypothetical protein CCAX7_22420 [Capsulimonas corticalis]|uniref:Uncharacterized protein n=1 Tax=Capsulimonas corticalis TaxID=2219043 RepID=A0A402D280_9BACT|nr:Gfo/Idh/MocA family oxidoreductase [Capsulimonas corticalis]BDI30191.1 hypothetical protein CCAX7_22420 [Capsulimonas corticalis]
MAQREIRFGVIGCGLMGREFASAAARWSHLLEMDVRPRIVGICDADPKTFGWFQDSSPDIKIATGDYQDLLNSSEIDAIYCAVPHNLHERIYIDIINAGKHLLGEKPFGIDLEANARVMDAVRAHPEVLVRCSSEFPFYPGAQRVIQAIQEERFGRILEVRAGFLHSSDLDPRKPINWKRRIATNGAYGCMGDLGLHVLHAPLRAGWAPRNVRAMLTNVVTHRPGPDGAPALCETWDNALLSCEVASGEQAFPMLLETKRIAPGETNTWYLQVYGTEFSAEFSTKYPKTLRTLPYAPGDEQAWRTLDLGPASCYPTITGGIFEFGFSDSILQMWAAFCDEIAHGDAMRQPFRCATPNETAQSHRVFTAALASQAQAQVIAID